MEDWEQETLEKALESKRKEYNQNKPTDIVCKYFLEAVEKKQYGCMVLGICPNGGKDCHYRHALPPGYSWICLKISDMKALIEEEAQKIPIEEEIENQCAKITTSTPMTPELLMEWKKKKIAEKEAGLAAQKAERAKNDHMSGRELFMSDASLFVDDAEAYEKYQREEESDAPEQKVNNNSAADEQSTSATSGGDAEALPDDEDDDELDIDELNELEASFAKTSIQIQEPNNDA